jgi:chemotaxis protein MotB
MRRRRSEDEESDNRDRWVVSYADFVTLLLAFFVVMYAISSVNEGRYRQVSEALVQAFQTTENKPDRSSIVPPPVQHTQPPKREQDVPLQGMANDIRSVLDPLVRAGQVRVTENARGVAVEINASVLFASGQAELAEASLRSLEAVAKVLARAPNAIEVEGYTDDSPINSPIFPSNWELSAARASRVVRLFADAGVDPARMGAIGYGENRSVDSNDTPEGRSRNRRVVVVILPLETGRPTQ